jgi:tetratricopeptide (TPR) repeat protein
VLLESGRLAELDEVLHGDLERASETGARVRAFERIAGLWEDEFGDGQAAGRNYEALLALEPRHVHALRAVERRRLQDLGKDLGSSDPHEALASLQATIADVTTDAALASALLVECAHARAAAAPGSGADLADLTRAAERDPRFRPALRALWDHAVSRGPEEPPAAVASLAERLADDPDLDRRSASLLRERAGEAWLALGQPDEAIARFRTAVAESGEQLSPLRALLQVALARDAHADAAAAADAASRSLHDPGERTRAALVAAAVEDRSLQAPEQALAAWRRVLAVEPTHPEAFDRAAALLEERGDHAGLAEVLAARAAADHDPAVAFDLYMRLAALLRGPLGDPAASKPHLQQALALQPTHREALALLSDLHYRDSEWGPAAELLIRRARLERDPVELSAIFRRLGIIYDEHIPDLQRAIASFGRVLEGAPEDRMALERLAALHERQGDVASALGTLARLVQLEADPGRKVELLLRSARLQEQGANLRGAVDTLKRALAAAPHDARTIGALAEFYDRRDDPTSAKVHLDVALQSLRQLAAGGADPAPYHTIFRAYVWRKDPDQAYATASLLEALGDAGDDERAFIARFALREQLPGPTLADPALDDFLYHPALPPGFRHLIRALDEGLQKLHRGDLKRFGVSKSDRLPRGGHAVSQLVAEVAGHLELADVEVYVAGGASSVLAIEPGEPTALILGSRLIERAHERELRFLLSRQLKMAQARLLVPLRMGADELAVLVAGLVRQFVQDFNPQGLDTAAVASESARVGKLVPKKQHAQLLPFALECAAADIDLRGLSAALAHSANRAGLVACGSIAHAVSALARLGDDAQTRELRRFIVSDEHTELRRAAGVAVG